MNILVTGANGQLGNEMRIVTKGSEDRYIFTDVCDEYPESLEMLHKLAGDDVDTTTTKLDITNLDAIRDMVKNYDVKAIINCAAWTNVDGAEAPEKFDLVELLNATAPENLAIAMKEVGGLLVHISTDYVFGGDPYNTPCKEDQNGTPTGVYGLTKLHGEQAILNTGVNYLIFRTAIFDIIENRMYDSTVGIYHYSNEGVCSWFDFTKMIAEYSGQKSCDILPCHSNEFPSPVKRPAYSVLDKTKLKDIYGIRVPYWTDSLGSCISNLID